jgi:isopenicillin-N epimerase
MKRRNFVKSITGSLAALPLLPRLGEALTEPLQNLHRDLEKLSGDQSQWTSAPWKRIRKEFLLNPDVIHLNCGSVGAVPRLVLDALSSYTYQLEGNPVRNTWGGLGAGTEAVRQKAAEFIGADLDETVLTRNTTEGMNAVATGIELEPGDEILTTNHEHGGGMVGWQHLVRHRGVKIVQIKMPVPVKDTPQILQLIRDHITPRTRVCCFSHVETISGLEMPLAEIAKITRPKGILLSCDGAQAPGMLQVDVKALGVDTYASSSHKWMLAPKGCGLLYIRKAVQERVQPVFTYSGPGSYSASSGTRNVAQILAHGVTMDFHNTIGRDRIEARCRQLSRRMRGHLDQVKGLRRITPDGTDLSSGIVSYSVDEAKGKNGTIANRLWQEHDIVVKVLPGTYKVEGGMAQENYNGLRFSTHIFNSETEVDRTANLIEAMLKKS